jgi:uncharacterized membrane protein
MLRTVYAILLGLLGAGIVHIAILLLLPSLSDRDAWSRLAEAGDLHTFVKLGGGGGTAALVTSADPHFQAAACRFDLADDPVHVQAEGSVPFWSISVYNRSGQNIYSYNDRTASERALDLVLATPAQAVALRRSLPAELERSVIVEMAADQGMVVLRSFIPDDSWRTRVEAYLAGAECAPRE